MFKYGVVSLERRKGINDKLIAADNLAMSYQIQDAMILEDGGLRTKERQKILVDKGASKTMNSLHIKGLALDKAPYPLDWNDLNRFYIQAQLMRYACIELRLSMTWGAVWDRRLQDLSPNLEAEVKAYVQRRKAIGRSAFLDFPHFQLEV